MRGGKRAIDLIDDNMPIGKSKQATIDVIAKNKRLIRNLQEVE